MAEISVIVPVYQAERYIGQCIDSILAQTFADFELILVDDGSKDNSGKICDEYAEKDSRVRVIHKENGGVAHARNDGMANAAGEYICFVDADDRMDDTMLEHCVSCIKENGADILRHGHITEIWKDGRCAAEEKVSAPGFAKALSHNQIAEEMEQFWRNCSNYVWNYFFKKDTIADIEFPDIKVSEDHIFVLKAIQRCEKICFLEEEPYRYCMRMGSSANRWQETGIECQLDMVRECYRFMDSFGIKEQQKTKLLSNLILNAYSYAIYLLCFPECNRSFKEKKEEIASVRSNLQVDMYVPYAEYGGLSAGDIIKRRLICRRMEKILLLLGPVFMRVVRKAKRQGKD
jgi:glycosyltransferase involved in cell wall biosynthesis